MSTAGKVTIGILVGAILLLLVGAGVGVYYISKYAPKMAEEAKRTQNEGRRFGQETDNAGCLKETLARIKKDDSLTGMMSINIFLATCLRESRPTPGFCDDVPSKNDRSASKDWANKKCAEAGHSGRTCLAVYQIVQAHCQSPVESSDREPPEKIEKEKVVPPHLKKLGDTQNK